MVNTTLKLKVLKTTMNGVLNHKFNNSPTYPNPGVDRQPRLQNAYTVREKLPFCAPPI